MNLQTIQMPNQELKTFVGSKISWHIIFCSQKKSSNAFPGNSGRSNPLV